MDELAGKSYYEIQEFLTLNKSNVKDSDGIFIGSKVPVHVIPVLILYFAKHSGRNSFLVLEENEGLFKILLKDYNCLLYTSPSPRDGLLSRMPSSA